ncbi:hypothetical protein [Nocardia sp. NPDC047648]|uniref:tetratricopeptide repeat protein n=1 Tax=Nocardia sp. NPDC047648 TaxID=3155625 RepID=UPI0033EF4A4E
MNYGKKRLTRIDSAFSQTMLGLAYSADITADLFSQACVEQFNNFDDSRYGYVFAQVFEPNVLREVSVLAQTEYSDAAGLRCRPSTAMEQLADKVERRSSLGITELVNLSAALISVSRFEVAQVVLETAKSRDFGSREAFEIAMLEFVIRNRVADGEGAADTFHRMRAAIRAGGVPDDRVLDACAQAVVWYLKRREVPEECFTWYLSVGRSLEGNRNLDSASMSSWYRAVAMWPAASGDKEATRAYMTRARESAEATFSERPRAYEKHLIKTYHESSVKEHMYVRRSCNDAKASAEALIELDPLWSPSYGEQGEMYAAFGEFELAAASFDRAVELGPPYVGYHLIQSAKAHERCENADRAVQRYRELTRLIGDDEVVLRTGLALARSSSHEAQEYFERRLRNLPTVGGLSAGDHHE